MYTKTALISALAGLAAAAPSPARRSESGTFGAISILSGSDIQNAFINANNYGFFIGKPSSSNCPAGVENLDCSNFNQTGTIFSAGSTGGLSLDVEVPGGQQVYVAYGGALGYTTPHSAAIPEGASLTSFSYTSAPEGSVGILKFNDQSFSACPTSETGVYQIYANAANIHTGCRVITIGTYVQDKAQIAWQY